MSYQNRLVDCFYQVVPYEITRKVYSLVKPDDYSRLQRFRKGVLGPFDEKQCIFIHIPKTGGISVANAVFGKGVGWHLSLRPYQKMYSREEFNKYFKFAFVRNPWDRVVSAYLYLKSGGLEEEDRVFTEKYLKHIESFDQFVIEWLNRESILEKIHFYPQYRFISLAHNDHIDVDFVGRFENLNEDFQHVCDRLGVKAQLKHVNVSKNRNKKDFKKYYTDRSTEIVADVYREDVRIFNYEF